MSEQQLPHVRVQVQAVRAPIAHSKDLDTVTKHKKNGFPQSIRSVILQQNQCNLLQLQLISPLCSQCSQSTSIVLNLLNSD